MKLSDKRQTFTDCNFSHELHALLGNEMQLLDVNKMTEAINKKNLTLAGQRELLEGQETLNRRHNKETKIFLSLLSS